MVKGLPQGVRKGPLIMKIWKEAVWELPEAVRGSLVSEGDGLLGKEGADLGQSEIAREKSALLASARQYGGPPG